MTSTERGTTPTALSVESSTDDPDADETAARQLLGRRLRALRTEQELSLRALASEVGCSASALSQIESGLGWPSVRLLARVARYLGASLDLLFDLGGPARTARTLSVDSLMLTSLSLEPEEFLPITSGNKGGVAFVHVAEGELTIETNHDAITVGQSSTVRFRSGHPMMCSNRSSSLCRALWGHVAVSEPYSHAAEQTHLTRSQRKDTP
ncbi:helix-turn-helix domain-containing protein [Microbacterium sp. HMH0099]|uniref:helix-turn-helix domain-containing protein n=1 Tax=Microbacterium sp. HMH0099 TaxID=3414026 RepID=UPI003BF71496